MDMDLSNLKAFGYQETLTKLACNRCRFTLSRITHPSSNTVAYVCQGRHVIGYSVERCGFALFVYGRQM